MYDIAPREHIEAARDRLTTWWNGGDIGRPALLLTYPREKPLPEFEKPIETPPGVTAGNYTVKDYAFRAAVGPVWAAGGNYAAEALPTVSPDLAPNCLALYLGCQGVEGQGTVWCEPCISSPEAAKFHADLKNNFYWNFTTRLTKEWLGRGKNRWFIGFPDLIEGLDTLAAMRDTQTLLMDLIERPDWVKDCLAQITREYFRCYDALYEMMKDDRGGTSFWAWAPGRMSKLQCDFSAMISADMFKEFMMPVLEEMTGKLDYCMYHFDGPCALQHHGHLMSLKNLTMLQWTPGTGNVQPAMHETWFDLYHRTIEAGKKIYIHGFSRDHVDAYKREFGAGFKQFMFPCWTSSKKEAEELIRACEM
ncbi:MAG: hypothetical protein LLG03_14090 [Planctomycetaceae bacterium]|nr:hypothetical protein [Planctomycetaceae bacterium]